MAAAAAGSFSASRLNVWSLGFRGSRIRFPVGHTDNETCMFHSLLGIKTDGVQFVMLITQNKRRLDWWYWTGGGSGAYELRYAYAAQFGTA